MHHIKDTDAHRVVGLKSVIGMCMAAMVGSVLVLPGPAVGITGSSAFLCICVSGICVLPGTLTLAEIVTAMPVSGGAYVFLSKAYGPMVGTMSGIGLWLILIAKGAFALGGFAVYLNPLVETSEWVEKAIAIGLLILITCLNLAGAKKLKVVQKWATLLALVVLSILTLVTFKDFDASKGFTDHFVTNGAMGFVEGTGFVYMGYAGLTKVAAIASDIKKPGKTLPRAMLISLGIMVPFFSLSLVAMTGTIKYKELKKDYAPFYSMALVSVGEVGAKVVSVLCIAAMASMANVALMAVSRFPYAMARDGLLPPVWSLVWERTNSPWVSILFASLITALSILFLPINKIAKLGSAFKLIVFIMINASCMVFRENAHKETWYKPEFIAPFYPYTQLFGMCAEFTMLVFMGVEGLLATLLTIVLGFIIYVIYGRHHALFTGVLKVDDLIGLGPKNPHPVAEEDKKNIKHHQICITEHDLEEEIHAFHTCPQFLGLPRGDGHCEVCDSHYSQLSKMSKKGTAKGLHRTDTNGSTSNVVAGTTAKGGGVELQETNGDDVDEAGYEGQAGARVPLISKKNKMGVRL